MEELKSMLRYLFALMLCLSIGFNPILAQRSASKIDSLRQEITHADEVQLAEIYNQLGYFYAKNDSLEVGMNYLNKGLYFATKHKREDIIAQIYCNLGDIYYQIDDVSNAQIQYLKGKQLSEKLNNTKLILHCLSGLGSVYFVNKEWNLSLKYIRQAMQVANNLNTMRYYPKLTNLIGMNYSGQGKFDSARFYYDQLIEYGRMKNDSIIIGFVYINIANISMRQLNFSEAIDWLNKAKLIHQVQTNTRGMATVYANIGECLLKLGDNKNALLNFNLSNSIAVSQNYLAILMLNYYNMSDIYSNIQNSDSSLVYFKLASEIKDSIYSIEKQKNIQSLMLKSMQEKSEQQISVLKQKAFVRSLYLYFASFAIILLLIIFYLIYRSFKLKIRLQEAEASKMVGTIDHQNRELVTMAMNLGQKKQLLSKVGAKVKNVTREEEGENLKNVLDEINSNIKTDEYLEQNWESFIKHFEGVHPSFIKNLQSKHSNLTTNELKHCAFIKLNLGIKQVAIMNNINVRSVQMIRYRLKKKFNLQIEDDLNQYLSRLK